MSTNRRFVIVGGGLAGAKIAEALRDRDFDGNAAVRIGRSSVCPSTLIGLEKGFRTSASLSNTGSAAD